MDKNITDRITKTGAGDIDTRKPTLKGKPFPITYEVSDSAGNRAMAKRLVSVVCPSGEYLCCGSVNHGTNSSNVTECKSPDGPSCTQGAASWGSQAMDHLGVLVCCINSARLVAQTLLCCVHRPAFLTCLVPGKTVTVHHAPAP